MDEYKEENYRYGYLTRKCSCGEPTSIEGNFYKPKACLSCTYKTDPVERCPGCGIMRLLSVSIICVSCRALDDRGKDSTRMRGVSCTYCGTKHGLEHIPTMESECIHICSGCKIEPLNCMNIKPAISRG